MFTFVGEINIVNENSCIYVPLTSYRHRQFKSIYTKQIPLCESETAVIFAPEYCDSCC